jgi:hypothetical protein
MQVGIDSFLAALYESARLPSFNPFFLDTSVRIASYN